MPLPRALGKLNRVGLNRIIRHVAPWFPGLALVQHTGRRTGRVYRTPVNVFVRDGRYAFALTYGPDTDWVRNVLAGDGCDVVTRGRRVRLARPRLVHDEPRAVVPRPVAPILRLLRVADFLILEPVGRPELPI